MSAKAVARNTDQAFVSLFTNENCELSYVRKFYESERQVAYLSIRLVSRSVNPVVVDFLITSVRSLHGTMTTMEIGVGDKKVEFSSEWFRKPETVLQTIEHVFSNPLEVQNCYLLVYENRNEVVEYLALR